MHININGFHRKFGNLMKVTSSCWQLSQLQSDSLVETMQGDQVIQSVAIDFLLFIGLHILHAL